MFVTFLTATTGAAIVVEKMLAKATVVIIEKNILTEQARDRIALWLRIGERGTDGYYYQQVNVTTGQSPVYLWDWKECKVLYGGYRKRSPCLVEEDNEAWRPVTLGFGSNVKRRMTLNRQGQLLAFIEPDPAVM